ncbi:hypothetical protein [Mycobacteroides abscessus]|uniref:hypothetical protein n=1 Tax=Mycobacteroides abscessus TaxID=36809 RepID=UPI000C25B9C3|nr:hypothetical protein [Mycobacteroides abscessus]
MNSKAQNESSPPSFPVQELPPTALSWGRDTGHQTLLGINALITAKGQRPTSAAPLNDSLCPARDPPLTLIHILDRSGTFERGH